MDNHPKISVLMSVYNTEFHLVKRALDSVLNQTFQDFEVIIIDDGSVNDAEHQLLNYAIKHENKFTYLRHRNCSQAISINRGVEISNGEYITIIDADDEYKPNHLSLCLQEMANADLIASKTETIIDQEDDYYLPDKNNLKNLIHVDECILFATLFGKKEVFLNLKFQGNYAADSDFYDCASKIYKVKKLDLRTYVYYRNIPSSITSKMKKQNSMIHSYVQSEN